LKQRLLLHLHRLAIVTVYFLPILAILEFFQQL